MVTFDTLGAVLKYKSMIGLLDCNNFFVSCERLFRPDLKGRPVLVLSSNDGCVIARSQEVKDLGISMGIPYFEIKDLCRREDITVFSSNFALYRDISSRVMQALRAEFDLCEVYSIDEAFFAIDNNINEETLGEIRARIIQKTGIPVSIGVGKTKTLAKVANRIAKDQHVRRTKSNMGEGVCVMSETLYDETMRGLPCGSVWGIGRQTSALLTQQSIHTVSELLAVDAAYVRKSFGVAGERLRLELQGMPVYVLGEKSVSQASYSSTRSFSAPTHDKSIVMSALGYHVEQVTRTLRKDHCVATHLTIIAKGSRYGAFAHRAGVKTAVLTFPTNDIFAFTREALKLCDALYDSEIPYKKVGVILRGISPYEDRPCSLFEDRLYSQKREQVNSVVDTISKRYGNGILHTGVVQEAKGWRTRSSMLSKEYTTQWADIAVVKANV